MLSIIIPVRNEVESLRVLLKRISKAFADYGRYEIIAVDDYSNDGSYELLLSLSKSYNNLRVIKKVGPIGKGTAVIEGINKAQYRAIALIDADLAFQPKQLLPLLKELSHYDIVVGNRVYSDDRRFVKRIFTQLFKFIFGKCMLGVDFDIMSGLKVFHKHVVSRMDLKSSQWSFELEFILKAVNAGYSVKGVPVQYSFRKKGEGKMNLFTAGFELVIMSIYFHIRPFGPRILNQDSSGNKEIKYNNKLYKPYTTLHHSQSAIYTLSFIQFVLILILLLCVIALFIYNWHTSLVHLISVITILYFFDLLFIFGLTILAFRKHAFDTKQIPKAQIKGRTQWPTYTILCPLYKEWDVIPQFISAIDALDYPKKKLQVFLVLEKDDVRTLKEVKKVKFPPYLKVLIVPDDFPKTKPKACNYALTHSTGEYTVIYDAEDIPDADQLKKAVITFEHAKNENVVCLQAKLNFYNPHQNLLTKLFTLEYSLWFNLTLMGLHIINGPIPLGGTSNHFKTKTLRLLEGWDPFNVAEDCDLGIRLFKYGYKTKMLDSYTLEEANADFIQWFKQRSRWNKGYIQTYLVHMRRPHEFFSDFGDFHIITFQFIVGGKILMSLINPFLWIITFSYIVLRALVGPFIESLYPPIIFYLAVASLIIGNFMYFYNYMIGAVKREQWEMVKYAYFAPFYWVMMSYATWIALVQIFTDPHYWEKTTHGLHLKQANS